MPPPARKPTTRQIDLQAEEDAGGRFAAEAGVVQLGRSLPTSSSVFGCSGLDNVGEALSSSRVMPSERLVTPRPSRCDGAIRIAEFVEPAFGARLARGQQFQQPPRAAGHGAEDGQLGQQRRC